MKGGISANGKEEKGSQEEEEGGEEGRQEALSFLHPS
jgi:hypothetical protein